MAPAPAPAGGRRRWWCLRDRGLGLGSAMGAPLRARCIAHRPAIYPEATAKEALVIAVTATLKAKAGKEQDLARAIQTLAQKVRANEPDCKLYQLARSKSDPQLFVLIERYTDDAALARHSNTDYFKAGIGEMMALVEGRPEIKLFDEI
jgi:quinol monooxygenase YgiN